MWSVSCSVVSDSLQPHGLQPSRLLCPWDSPGKNTGVGCDFLLQGVFLTQGSNSHLLHCRQSFYQLSHQDPWEPCAGHRVRVLLQVNLSRHPLPSALAFLLLLDCTGHQEWSGILVRFPSSCGCGLKEGFLFHSKETGSTSPSFSSFHARLPFGQKSTPSSSSLYSPSLVYLLNFSYALA